MDGVIERTTPDGKLLLQSGTGFTHSSGSVRFSMRDAAAANISRDYSIAKVY
ncbi:MAG UNVERIFIED_CONTAM: hypothetical protein LVQ98_01495 [Rickettsiaceae bacterium]|jgi:hypothetical protein